MKRLNVALVSFDWRRAKDPAIALGHANVSASLRKLMDKHDLQIFDISYNINNMELNDPKNIDNFIDNSISDITSKKPDLVAFGAFVWNETFIQRIGKVFHCQKSIKSIILAGPQISYSPVGSLEKNYPFGSIFIRGYAENAMNFLVDNIMTHGLHSRRSISGIHYAGDDDAGLQATVDLEQVPSPFLGDSPVIDTENRSFVRWESQRGCPFRCSFCQHKDQYSKRVSIGSSRIDAEINHFKSSTINDIAVLDPTFNSGPNYMQVLEKLKGFKGKLSLQCRFEMIRPEFLNLCNALQSNGCDIILEFGIQTTNLLESKACRRVNQLGVIRKNSEKLREHDIPFEISLIYGLPHQTVSSFKESIDFCRLLKPNKLVAWPLMLLRGTEMHTKKSEFGLEEKVLEYNNNGTRAELGIPHVISSPSFSESDWIEMKRLAEQL